MRNLFLLILLINLLAFAYQNWIMEPGTPVEATFLAQGIPELQSAAIPVVEVVAEVPGEVAVGEYGCLRIGPFATSSAAAAIQKTLQERGALVRRTTEISRDWIGYWVQTAGQGSRKAAEKTLVSLIEGGMPDAYVLSGELDYRISLGVFRKPSSADQVMRDARLLGFDTRVIERYQENEDIWLQASIAADQPLRPGDLRAESGQILRTEPLDCDTAQL